MNRSPGPPAPSRAAALRAGAALAALLLALPPAARAQTAPPSTHLTTRGLAIEAGSGQVITLGATAASVFAADPKVAEVRPASPTSLFVFGVGPGHTTVAAMDGAGKVIAQYDVTVRPSSFSASEASGALHNALPGRDVHIAQTSNGLALTGNVASPEEAERVVTTAKSYLQSKQTLDNQLRVAAPVQVSLHVRIAEMSRQVSRSLGINWQAVGAVVGHSLKASTDPLTGTTTATNLNGIVNPIEGTLTNAIPAGTFALAYLNSGIDIGSVIDALAQDNLARVLAEPDLTAISGETASFLAGGEFPIPVSQALNQVTVTFKQYGISLAFVPTVLSDGRISLRVRPEVSQLTTLGAVQLQAGNNSLSIPALTVRRADTTVEVGSGQSFAIAGLLSDNTTQQASNIPWLGDIPVLGALFRADNYSRTQDELVIVVTPYIVKPVSQASDLRLPTDGYRAPNDLERLFLLRQTALGRDRADAPAAVHIPGSAGFIVQ